MTDPQAGAAAPGTDAQAAAQAPALTVNGQYVKDLSFENPGAPATLMQAGQRAPNVAVAIDVNARRISDLTFEVALAIRAEGKHEAATLFIAEIEYAGVFSIGKLVPQEYVQPIVLIEAPRLLFPFARAIVSDMVRDGGFPPLLIHPIDFAQLFQQRAAQAQQGQVPAAAAPQAAPAGDGKVKFELE
ncbi:MAG: protein-export chaperone SecB [Alphaproteobacteria bacterium]|nr:protein-export chaperone SecB [Alphaproteobacteria bacterium]